jgi:hypothetical protein
MLIDRFLNALIHFYVNQANAIYAHRLHVENLYDQPPKFQIKNNILLKINDRNETCNLPSSVLWIVTHFVGICPLDVTAATNASSSSFLSFSFFTKLKKNNISISPEHFDDYLSIARLANVSLSPFVRCLWHKRVATIPLHASDEGPPPFDEDAPFDGGLWEWSGGEADIILDDEAAAAAAAKDGWIRRSSLSVLCQIVLFVEK